MSTKKTITIIVAALVTVAVLFLLVLATAGTPKGTLPPANKAPSPN